MPFFYKITFHRNNAIDVTTTTNRKEFAIFTTY